MIKLYDYFGKQFICERKNWKKCVDHRHLQPTPPARFTPSGVSIPEDEPMYSMDGPILTSEEFLAMREEPKFTIPVRLSMEEVMECDMDTLQQTLGRMIAGEHYSHKDIVIFSRDKIENNVVFFTVTYMPSKNVQP